MASPRVLTPTALPSPDASPRVTRDAIKDTKTTKTETKTTKAKTTKPAKADKPDKPDTTSIKNKYTSTKSPPRRRLAKFRHRQSQSTPFSFSALPPPPPPLDPPVLSFYGAEPVPLPSRFLQLKRRLADGHRDALRASWVRLLEALAADARHLAAKGGSVVPEIQFGDIGDETKSAEFGVSLRTYGVGIIRGVIPPEQAAAWAADARAAVGDERGPPHDPDCLDRFWTAAQVRARGHPNMLAAQRFAMGFWGAKGVKETSKEKMSNDDNNDNDNNTTPSDDPPVVRFPIAYADRLRVHAHSGPFVSDGPLMAQIDGGSLERWEPDGYGRGGTYAPIFRGAWEDYDPWAAAGRVHATADLYNGAGACSVFRMFQGLVALAAAAPGAVRLLPSPQRGVAYVLLRPFFRPKEPRGDDDDDLEAYLAPANWTDDDSTLLHGAVPGHAQRVTARWHPHLRLQETLVASPALAAGDYIVWHCDTPYAWGPAKKGTEKDAKEAQPTEVPEKAGKSTTTTTTPSTSTTPASPSSSPSSSPPTLSPPLLVYAPACPLTQTNALYLARQRKAFLRGQPGPDFDAGATLGSEAATPRLDAAAIAAIGGDPALCAMGLRPWDMDASLSRAERDVVRLANMILFPDAYAFLPTRASSPTADG